MLGLYLHIPFCAAICAYCNFNRGLLDAALKTRYVAALEREIRARPRDGDGPADTIFFGGGTPSLLEPAEIGRLIARLPRDVDASPADAEITLETNPETATAGRLDASATPASIASASASSRSTTRSWPARADPLRRARGGGASATRARAGFDNLSFDLMFWLPGQSFASWLRTVDAAIALAPDHLSLYLLELYPNAPLKEAMARGPALGEPGLSSG